MNKNLKLILAVLILFGCNTPHDNSRNNQDHANEFNGKMAKTYE
jgi:hypothetical protein